MRTVLSKKVAQEAMATTARRAAFGGACGSPILVRQITIKSRDLMSLKNQTWEINSSNSSAMQDLKN